MECGEALRQELFMSLLLISFPLGVTMTLKRRKALLEFAEKRGAYILEDDYNAEFRFSGPPLPCLQGLDRAGCVIYAGTMSKILYPSLRLGYLVVPPALADPVARLRTAIDQHSPTIDQATLLVLSPRLLPQSCA
jgi:GntR family transcriptional regulator/MocR family aminotransferase